MEVELHAVSTVELDSGKCSTYASGRLTPGKSPVCQSDKRLGGHKDPVWLLWKIEYFASVTDSAASFLIFSNKDIIQLRLMVPLISR